MDYSFHTLDVHSQEFDNISSISFLTMSSLSSKRAFLSIFIASFPPILPMAHAEYSLMRGSSSWRAFSRLGRYFSSPLFPMTMAALRLK